MQVDSTITSYLLLRPASDGTVTVTGYRSTNIGMWHKSHYINDVRDDAKNRATHQRL